MSGHVRIEREGRKGHVAQLIFDHAARRNAITVSMWEAIPEAVREVEEDESCAGRRDARSGDRGLRVGRGHLGVRAGRGRGDAGPTYDALTARAFSALQCARQAAHRPRFTVFASVEAPRSRSLRTFDTQPKTRRFAVPPARLGLGYHTAGIQALIQDRGYSVCTPSLLFTARRVSTPTEARRIGLVNEVFQKGQSSTATVDAILARTIANQRTADLAQREGHASGTRAT